MDTCINYLDMYASRSEAWQHCQDIYWMLVMLDDSGYSSSRECFYPMMQYTCEIASSYSCYFDADLSKKFEYYVHRFFDKETEYSIKLKGELIEYKYIFAKYKNQRSDVKKIVKFVLEPKIELKQKMAIAVRYGLKLGTNEIELVKRLRELIPNPYLLSLELIDDKKWWLTPPKSRNIIESSKCWLESLLNKKRQERKDFFKFISQCNGLEQAWSSCQKAEWLLALIDLYTNYADTAQAQSALRKFLCQLATEDNMFNEPDVDCNVKIAVEIVEQFINGKANLKDLKVMEIEVLESLENCRSIYYNVTNKALRCTYQSAWVAALEAVRDIPGSIEAVRLRELVSNPFI